MRKLATVAVAVGLFVGGMGTAVADGWHKIPDLQASGVLFSAGKYKWQPKGRDHGGLRFEGKLHDAEHRDGHNVYLDTRVEGYGWKRFKGVQGRTVFLNKVIYDGAVQRTGEARLRACRDRGSLRPDNCSSEVHYLRNSR
ncbi:hypothetical protein [Streptomyces sp. NPDC008121]|uniref:hypothetical protein n=1 Tax=Streptomyces sp. NPDC008121 TaxID=3364809 RepID=UPI0036E900BC